MFTRSVATALGCIWILMCLVGGAAFASTSVVASDPSGLGATAEFGFSGNTLMIVMTNTSTGVPVGFDSADQILTSVSFLLPGVNTIVAGSAIISAGSASDNFDPNGTAGPISLFGGDDVSVEYGFGNSGSTGLLSNLISTTNATSTTIFQVIDATHPNLDGPDVLDGPQAGITNGIVSLGGLGAINNSVKFTLTLAGALSDLSFLEDGVIFEFGSDVAFLSGGPPPSGGNPAVPEPSSVVLFGIGIGMLACGGFVRRRHCRASS